MKKFRIFPLILILCLFFGALAPAADALGEPPLHSAKAVVLADLSSGRLLYSKNADERRSPASLTKVMTALIAVEELESGRFSLDDMLTAQPDCLAGLDTDSSTSGIQPGETISYRDLLYCAMVHSANEACNILAYHISGSVEAFVGRMNERAAELGCVDTHFSDPNGLSNENHYTTAYEMYLITAEAITHPLFAELYSAKGYDMPATNISQARSFSSSNALITTESMYGDKYVYPYAVGGKTGFTQLAGYCLVSTAEKDDVRLLAVVMGCDGYLNSDITDYENFSDTIALYDWAFENFAYRTAVSASEAVSRVRVDLTSESDEYLNLRPRSDVVMLLPKDLEPSAIELRPEIYDELLVAPIEAGTTLGRADILINGERCGSVELVNISEVPLAKSEFLRRNIRMTLAKPWVKLLIVLVVLLLGGYIALVVRYRVMRRRYLRRRREAAARRARERARSYPPQYDSTQMYSSFDGRGRSDERENR